VALALGTLLLGGCGTPSSSSSASSSSGPAPGQVTTSADGVQHVTLQTGDDYMFRPMTFSVKPGEVALTVTDVGHDVSHNFLFSDGNPQPIGANILLLTAGSKKTIDFTVTTPGAYRYECSFHTDLGMVGTMTVSG
jgi:plastocyanin